MSTYPTSYKPKSLADQAKILKGYLPSLKVPKGKSKNLYLLAEGLFLIPNPKLIAPTYNEAVEKVLGWIEESRPFYNYRKGETGKKYLKQIDRKKDFWTTVPDVVVLPAQFGLLHKGKSINQVRDNLQSDEIPLGAYEVGIMLLTHPERLQSYNDLWIDCAGDEYSPGGDGSFSKSVYFVFGGGRLWVVWRFLGDASGYYGSASGFGAQALDPRHLATVESLSLDSAIQIVKKAGYKIIEEK